MRVHFELRVPPGEREDGKGGFKDPVPYIVKENDTEAPRASGGRLLNSVAHVATEDEKKQYAAEFEEFEEKVDKGEITAAPGDPDSLIPSQKPPTTVQIQITPEMVKAVEAQEKQQAEERKKQTEHARTSQPSTTEAAQQGDTDLSGMNVDDAAQRIYATTDRDALTRMRRAETHGKNRKSVLDAIDTQRDNLKHQG